MAGLLAVRWLVRTAVHRCLAVQAATARALWHSAPPARGWCCRAAPGPPCTAAARTRSVVREPPDLQQATQAFKYGAQLKGRERTQGISSTKASMTRFLSSFTLARCSYCSANCRTCTESSAGCRWHACVHVRKEGLKAEQHPHLVARRSSCVSGKGLWHDVFRERLHG